MKLNDRNVLPTKTKNTVRITEVDGPFKPVETLLPGEENRGVCS